MARWGHHTSVLQSCRACNERLGTTHIRSHLGVIPLLGAPMAGASDRLLSQAVEAAAARNLVGPNDHVVRAIMYYGPTCVVTTPLQSS